MYLGVFTGFFLFRSEDNGKSSARERHGVLFIPAMCFSPRNLRCFISYINIVILLFKPEHSNVYTLQLGTRITLATKWYYRQIATVMVIVVVNFLKSNELR